MSDTILKIISTDPFYTCKKNTEQDIVSLLSKLYPAQQIEIHNTEYVEFIDQGQNFENVACNLCGQLLEIEYWQHLIDIASSANFNHLNFVTTCCSKETSLNNLNYNSPAGFARFVITLTNIETEMGENEIIELKTLMQTDIRMIWAKY